jgi:hypothetical protein
MEKAAVAIFTSVAMVKLLMNEQCARHRLRFSGIIKPLDILTVLSRQKNERKTQGAEL